MENSAGGTRQSQRKCPGCGSSQQALIGTIPDSFFFAGRLLDEALEGGGLWRCLDCGLRFRYPRLDKTTLDELYRQGGEGTWQTADESREDWNLVRRRIEPKLAGNRILDIGCFDGRFLASLEPAWDKFGIEIIPMAARIAETHGVRILGHDFSALGTQQGCFGVVTAFDVIEHVENPRVFLQQCANALSSGGLLAIATGNTNSLPWKLLGACNHYCVCPEHISFIDPRWCEHVAGGVGLELVDVHCYRRLRAGWIRQGKDFVANVGFATFPGLFQWLRQQGFGHVRHHSMIAYPPLWPTAKDHFVAFFCKRK